MIDQQQPPIRIVVDFVCFPVTLQNICHKTLRALLGASDGLTEAAFCDRTRETGDGWTWNSHARTAALFLRRKLSFESRIAVRGRCGAVGGNNHRPGPEGCRIALLLCKPFSPRPG